ncbi:MAG TPA: hypothetical protein P5243_09155 [Bacteroidales bacterium]|nr:hypothetical protein [Bacteroidales bacterium]HRS19661.1 hypothetical protein [Bacteroidales bacterium]
MEKSTKYQLPTILPHGWRNEVSKLLGIHRMTVYKALQRGENDAMYKKIMHVAAQKYGKPTN